MFGSNADSLAELGSGEAATVIADPLFIDPAVDNFRLQAGSQAIGKGVVYAGDTLDLEGVALGSTPNIGAFEYNSI